MPPVVVAPDVDAVETPDVIRLRLIMLNRFEMGDDDDEDMSRPPIEAGSSLLAKAS